VARGEPQIRHFKQERGTCKMKMFLVYPERPDAY
jgi:hypothetical protein